MMGREREVEFRRLWHFRDRSWQAVNKDDETRHRSRRSGPYVAPLPSNRKVRVTTI
jgi:hypothetical protein